MSAFGEDDGIRIIGVAVPPAIATATRAAAKKEMVAMSVIMRRALLAELKARGFLPKEFDTAA